MLGVRCTEPETRTPIRMRIAMSPHSPQTAPVQAAPNLARPRFDAGSDALVAWLDSVRAAGVRQAGPALILALESLRRADLSPARRFSVLRLLKAAVLKTCGGLPKPRDWATLPASGGGAPPRGITVEQRLYRLMFQGLIQALYQLDRCYFMLDGRQLRRRNWAVRNLFRFFDRQLRYAALWGGTLPEHAWRDLHDLYVYLTVRRQPGGVGPADPMLRTIDPELEYKQILLFGLAARLAPSGIRTGVLLDGLRHWALQTQLDEPQCAHGAAGLLVVDLAQDGPPRRHPAPLAADFRGWVLVPPDGFMDHLRHGIHGGEAARLAPPSALGPTAVPARA
jgi:hypothetical protein